MNNRQERDLVEEAKRLLDQAEDDLDGATLSNLQRARNQALTKREPRPPWLRRPLILTGAAGSALATAMLAVFLVLRPAEQDMIDTNVMADLGIMTSEESLEFFEEIDFYEWLSTVDEPGGHLSGPRGVVPELCPRDLGQGSDSGDGGRDAGDGNAGVSRII